ncbi:pyruvate kinase [Ramicandelaber brevisporus]|nr:pyruvate kinase [Ramicandelaber brevisporus]
MSFNNDTVATTLEWRSKLDIDMVPSHVRKSSIIATIGPKTNSPEMITALRQAGVNIVRMNFSHGTYEYHGSVVANVRKSITDVPGKSVAIALDTKGPEIRTGNMVNDVDVPIEAGHEMVLTVDPQYADKGTAERMYIDYTNLPKVVDIGKKIYVDDGILSFKVLEKGDDYVKVKAINAGKLCNKKGVNLPKTNVDLPALSKKDIADLRFGVEQNVDMIFASFIRCAEDVRQIRQVLGEDGKHIKIISKIENHQGVRNFDEILKETDGVMVARGDLGIEIPAPAVFIAQKMMIAKCNMAGKPVICATQMLESMTSNPRPTRAEVSDVANAILDGADCVMLSGETAKGLYPVETVEMMSHVCHLAESTICYPPYFNEIRQLTPRPTSVTEATCSSAVNAASEQGASAILVLSTTGESARLVAKYRPAVPIITITRTPHVSRQVHLYRGSYPFLYERPQTLPKVDEVGTQKYREAWQEDVDSRITWGMEQAKQYGLLKSGDVVIVVQGWKGGIGNTNTMRIVQCP